MRFSTLLLLSLVCALTLTACAQSSTTANVVAVHSPVRQCKVAGFGCFVTATAPGTVAFRLRNNLGTTAQDVTVAFVSKECPPKSSSVSLGPVPNGVETEARFTCSTGAPADVDGVITVTYRTRDSATLESVDGSLAIRAPQY